MSEFKWYILHTVSGFENKVAKQIEEAVAKKNMSDLIGRVVVPTESVMEIKRGQKVSAEKKFLPGYILVSMILNDNSWHLVKNIPKVSGFLGGSKPLPVSEAEVSRVFVQMEEGATITKTVVSFEVGDSVKVIDGPFDSFIGSVSDVDNEKSRLKVSVSIFGRATPVDLEFSQVEKINS